MLGNGYPVIEQPFAARGYAKAGLHGQAMVPKADHHVVRVMRDPVAHDPMHEHSALPLTEETWDTALAHSFTEVVVRDESQVPKP